MSNQFPLNRFNTVVPRQAPRVINPGFITNLVNPLGREMFNVDDDDSDDDDSDDEFDDDEFDDDESDDEPNEANENDKINDESIVLGFLPRGDYYLQNIPRDDEFKFNATTENSNYIQEMIKTSRQILPSLETFIQIAEIFESLNIKPKNEFDISKDKNKTVYKNRALYPSYLRNASPFEIYQVYKGKPIDYAKKLIEFIRKKNWDKSYIDEKSNIINNLMGQRGYVYTYWGYASGVNVQDKPLNRENFLASLTTDQKILMEAWRIKTLHGSVGGKNEFEFGLFPLPGNPERNIRLKNSTLNGFKKKQLMRVIYNNNHDNVFNRDFIRYKGEQAIDKNGRDITNKKLSMNQTLPKAYYMMIYNELSARHVLE